MSRMLLTWSNVVSGCRDSNPGPPAPKAGALTKLRHIPLASEAYTVSACGGARSYPGG